MYFLCAGLAQVVEQRIRNAWVVCSSHITGTILFKGLGQNLTPFFYKNVSKTSPSSFLHKSLKYNDFYNVMKHRFYNIWHKFGTIFESYNHKIILTHYQLFNNMMK